MRLFHRHHRLIVWVAIIAILTASSMRSLLIFGPLDIGGVPFGQDFCITGPAVVFDLPWEEKTPDKPGYCPFCRLDVDHWHPPFLALQLPPDSPAVISPTAVCETGKYHSLAAIPWRSRAPPAVS